jgi:ribosomal protein S27E
MPRLFFIGNVRRLGRRFGRLKVIALAGNPRSPKTGFPRHAVWCRCDCGNEKITYWHYLINGHCESCGCIIANFVWPRGRAHASFVHGHCRTGTGHSYHAMRNRCENPNVAAYKDYGGRGIKICKRWLGKRGFINFLEDMGVRPEGKTLDRIRVNGNYTPSNCRWATPKQQTANRRCSKPVADLPFDEDPLLDTF